MDPTIVFILAVPERRDAEGEGGRRPGGRRFKKAGSWGQQGGRGKEVSCIIIIYLYVPLSEVLNIYIESIKVFLLVSSNMSPRNANGCVCPYTYSVIFHAL